MKVDISELLQVGIILTKLSPSWNEYRKKLLHTIENFTLDQLMKHLSIEEESRVSEKKFVSESGHKVNYIDENNKN